MNKGNCGNGNQKRSREESQSPDTPPLSSRKKQTMDIAAAVEAITKSMSEMRREFGSQMSELKDSFNESLESKFGTWQQDKAQIIQKQTDLENRIDQLERQQKRNNIVITGLNSVAGDTRNAKTIANELFTNQMQQTVSCLEAFQMKTKNGETKIVAKMGSLDDKLRVMKGGRDSIKDGKKIFLSDDLIKKDQFMMFMARKFRDQAKNENKEAKIAFGKVFVNGVAHVWDAEAQTFVNRKN